MDFMLVHHRVKDFPQWKIIYDEHQPERQKAGLKEVRLFHAIDDPNDVTMIFEAPDLQKARAFATSETLHQAMERSGVVGGADFSYFKD